MLYIFTCIVASSFGQPSSLPSDISLIQYHFPSRLNLLLTNYNLINANYYSKISSCTSKLYQPNCSTIPQANSPSFSPKVRLDFLSFFRLLLSNMGNVSSATGEPVLEKDIENEGADATETATPSQMRIQSRRSGILPEEDSIMEDLTLV